MTDAQIRRYARHILLPDVGGVGQARLLAGACRVAVGPGRGAETWALAYLAAAGVGTIGLAGDLAAPITADEQRAQPIYLAEDVGAPRGAALARRLAALNPDVRVVPATELPGDAPAIAPPAVDDWLPGPAHPAAAVARDCLRGGLAAHQLLARLYAP